MGAEPVTEAGRDMVTWLDGIDPNQHRAHVTDVFAIEAEARAAALADVAAKVEALFLDNVPSCGDCGVEIDIHTDCPEGDGHIVWEPLAAIRSLLALNTDKGGKAP